MGVLERTQVVDVPPDALPRLGAAAHPLVVLNRRLVVRHQVHVPRQEEAQGDNEGERHNRREGLQREEEGMRRTSGRAELNV